MPFTFSNVEYCDMHFVYGFCNGSARSAVQEYERRFPDRRIPSRSVFTRIHQTLRDTGALPSVSVQSEREIGRTYAGVANITRGRFISLPRPKGTTSGTRRLCSTYGFVPLGKSTSGTVKRNFIH